MRFLLILASLGLAVAENGLSGWLRYAPLPREKRPHYDLPNGIVALNDTKTSPVYTAGIELQNGFKGIFGSSLRISSQKGRDSVSVVVGTVDQYVKAYGKIGKLPDLEEEYVLSYVRVMKYRELRTPRFNEKILTR